MASGGAAVKLDALAETLTFHAVQDMDYRGRDAVQWIAQSPVRVLEGQARGTRGAEGGTEAGLLVSRVVDRENGQTLAVHYLLWARWAEAGEAQLRTLRHAMRLEQACDDSVAAFLARLTGRAPARQASGAAVLVEGIGRLLALLDVLENYPARGRATQPAVQETPPEPFHLGDAGGLLEASMSASRVFDTLAQGE
ncbi:hypothetical protein [Cupriavidus basilensis]|uniref:hypothetical protein n=1 Tax=Cupriavidus basilensis TaxID=68895 RepID=UPI0002E4D1E9|nr:hypothetical protein [Cupriavidus basilensis]